MDGFRIPVRVSCYSGYRGEEYPCEFVVWERAQKVLEIVDQWLAPEHRYFKVRADDNATYIIRHDHETQTWELTLYSKIN